MRLSTRTAAISAGLLLISCATVGGEASDAAGVTGKQWIVEEIDGQQVIGDAHASLLFGADGRLSGNASCNRLTGTYSVRDSKLRIGPLGLTMMACAPPLMEQEQRLVGALESVEQYRVDDGGALVLLTRSGAAIRARADR